MKASTWSTQTEYHFISLYQAEPVLWKPIHRIGMDNTDRESAWARISKKMGRSVQDLKHLRGLLYARFLRCLRRYQKISQSGEKFEIYNPDWFANDSINSFFGSIYQSKLGCKKASIKYPVKKAGAAENCDPELKEESSDADRRQEDNCKHPITNYLSSLVKHHRKNLPQRSGLSSEALVIPTLKEERTKNDSSVNTGSSLKPLDLSSNNHSSSCQNRPSLSAPVRVPAINKELSLLKDPVKTAQDDCDLYSALLASKLRKIPERDRLQLMYKIDGLLIGGMVPQDLSVKPPSPLVPNFFPFSYPVTSQFSSYFQQSVMGDKSGHCSAFSVIPPK